MVLTIYDILLPPIFIAIIFFISYIHQKRNIIKMPEYKWYTKGLMVKFVGAISLGLIYQFYYGGGDTLNYFTTSRAICNMFSKDMNTFFDIMLGNNSIENLTRFDNITGYPVYWKDEKALFVSRLVVPLCFLSFKSFLATSILLAWISYSGVWKFFLLFNKIFPALEKKFALSILFVPSVVFWGSGLLKDTVTLAAVGWYTYSFYYFFIKSEYNPKGLINILVSSFLLIGIKPYILFALLPGSIIWLSNEQVEKIKSKLIKFVAGPIFILSGVIIGFVVLTQMNDLLGVYALDKVLDKAVESNYDQKQAYYGGNSFDIGDIKADPSSMLSKAHLAIAATLFRPYLWDVRNPVMLLSALENTYVMLLTIILLIRLKFWNFFTLIGKNPLLLFSVLFSLFFAFSVGIATSNFGTLVRLKIPCIPFFASSLFVLKHLYEEKNNKKIRF